LPEKMRKMPETEASQSNLPSLPLTQGDRAFYKGYSSMQK